MAAVQARSRATYSTLAHCLHTQRVLWEASCHFTTGVGISSLFFFIFGKDSQEKLQEEACKRKECLEEGLKESCKKQLEEACRRKEHLKECQKELKEKARKQ